MHINLVIDRYTGNKENIKTNLLLLLKKNCSKTRITFSFYIIVHTSNKIAGAYVKGSEINEDKFYEDKNLIKWFTVCPGPNEGDDTFELCIAGHDEHRLYYDETHK